MLRRIGAAIALVLVPLVVAACSGGSSRPSRWCEFDATDSVVDDSYCRNNTPGYEWEPDTDRPAKKPKVSVTKTPIRPTSAPRPRTSAPKPPPAPTTRR